MTTAATALLGLALPVTAELQGTWGDVVNNSLTSLLDTAVAGTTTLSTDGDVTLTTTTLAANQARQAILLCSGARTAIRTITAPAQSKIYTIINATTGGFAVKLVGVGPTTGLTIPNGASAVVAWNGSDFIEIGSSTIGNLTVNGNLTVTGTSTLTGAATLTANPTLSAGTANGVAYLNGSKVVTTGSALTFDGSKVAIATAGNDQLTWSAAGKTGYLYIDSAGVGIGDTALLSGNNTYYNKTSNYIANYINGSEQMRLTSTGLGIGTSSPLSKLDVVGAIRAVTASTAANNLRVGNTGNSLYLGVDSSTGGTNIVGSVAYATTLVTNTAIQLSTNNGASVQATLDSSGNLGIGTSSPSDVLTLAGGASGSYGLTINNSKVGGGTKAIFQYDATNAIALVGGNTTNGLAFQTLTSGSLTTKATIDSSGNLGLGVTPSAWGSGFKAIDVSTYGAVSSSSSAFRLFANSYGDGTNWIYKTTGAASRYDQSGGLHSWFTAPSGTAGNAITFTQAMTLDASGNLGVGTTSPAAKLMVIGTGGASLYIDSSAGGNNIYDATNHIWRSNSGGSERARINSSGAFLVGATVAGLSNANYFYFDPAAGYGGNALIGHVSGTASGVPYFTFAYNGSNIGSITQSGTTAVLYNVTSDQRLKENIVDAPEFGSVIDAMQVRSYDWKADGNHQRAGFVAQELVNVAPEAVHQPADPEEMMAVDYSKLVPMLVKEIQSLRQRVAQLEGK